MHDIITVLDIVTRDPQATLYYLQALAYGMAFHAMRTGNGHPPGSVDLVSGAVHAALALLHQIPHT
ncbi:hypothetical protein [Azospirillum sp.]|uniref:hypothetical protein n=1 Tax=Azospirillum sp. TaxID=34012 RepID=UPI0026048123|nr:hypothetical protein [Azospirillum sp.]